MLDCLKMASNYRLKSLGLGISTSTISFITSGEFERIEKGNRYQNDSLTLPTLKNNTD